MHLFALGLGHAEVQRVRGVGRQCIKGQVRRILAKSGRRTIREAAVDILLVAILG